MKPRTLTWLLVACSLTAWPVIASGQDQPPAVPSQATPVPPTPAPVRVGSGLRPPTKTKHVNPVYPREAMAAGAQGVVVLEAVIGVDGRVHDAKVLRSIPLLDGPAADAVRQWEFEPTLLNGAPVAVIMTVSVNFSMGGAPASPPVSPGMILIQQQRRPDGWAVWEITAARANGLAVWSSNAGEPPLSLAQAMTTGEAWLATQVPDAKGFDLASASLTRLQPLLLPGRWFYYLIYEPALPGQRLPGSSLAAVVLMDGSVVEPRIVPPR